MALSVHTCILSYANEGSTLLYSAVRDSPLHVIPPASSTSTSSDGSTKRKRQPHKDTFKQYLSFNRALLFTSVKDHQERSEGREDEDEDDEDDTTNRDEGKTKTKRGFSIM